MTRPIALKSSTATGSPRRRAAWLILGWLAFWLTSASPACEFIIDGNQTGQPPPSASSVAVLQPSSERPHDPATGGAHCPDVSAVSVIATFAATPQGGNLDTPPSPGPETLIARRHGWSGDFVPGASPPLPRLPLYLRIARLLI